MKARDTVALPWGFCDLEIQVGTPRFTLHGKACEAPFNLIAGRCAVDGMGIAFAVLMGESPTHVLMSQDNVVMCRIAPGNRGWCALEPEDVGVSVHAQGPHDGAGGCIVAVHDMTGAVIHAYPAPYGSDGILQVIGPTRIRSSALAAGHFGGIMWWNRVEFTDKDGGVWSAGQTEQIPPGATNAGYGLMHPDGTIQITSRGLGTNFAAYLAVSNGVPRLALQDPSPNFQTPDPDDIQWVPLSECNKPQPAPTPTPEPPQPPVEPIPVPVPPPTPVPTPTEPPAPPQVPAQRPKWQRRLGSVLRWLEKAGL